MFKKRILCAMSGGVDSSVAALLLKKQGYDVIGIFMNFWSEKKKNSPQNRCCSLESAHFARSIARKLKIKFYSLNQKELFKQKVVNNYLSESSLARTANPCAVCNRQIKFGQLLKIAANLGANKVATGHYAQIIKNNNGYELHRGADSKKDQSYFLWQLERSFLPKIKFPVGNYTKEKIRELAKKNGLITYKRKDSQGLCFIGDSNYNFIKKYAKNLLQPGNVVDNQGQIIGKHKGLAFYTIGQRAGFLISNNKWRKEKINLPPLYVIKLDTKNNQLIVAEDKYTYTKSINILNLNWLAPAINHPLAQIRYQHKAVKCEIKNISRGKFSACFNQPQRAATPGQSCVFYHKNKLLGGGIINSEN